MLRLWLLRPGARLLVWSLKKQLFWQSVVGTTTVQCSLKGRGFATPPTYHTAPFQSVKFCGA